MGLDTHRPEHHRHPAQRRACRWSSCWSPAGRWTSPPRCGNWNALVAAWLPGTEGQGVADVLFGVVRADRQAAGDLDAVGVSQQPINDGDGKAPLFPYGFGLTYAPTGDTQPPTAPGTPAASNLSCTSVTLPGPPRRTTPAR